MNQVVVWSINVDILLNLTQVNLVNSDLSEIFSSGAATVRPTEETLVDLVNNGLYGTGLWRSS